MRAVVMREFGPPDVLKPAEADEVRAGPDEVVIDVEFANVTFVETQVRAGRRTRRCSRRCRPSWATASAARRLGRRVVASLNGTGGYAERAVSPRRG